MTNIHAARPAFNPPPDPWATRRADIEARIALLAGELASLKPRTPLWSRQYARTPQPMPPRIADMVAQIARCAGLTAEDLTGPGQTRTVARTRQLAMYELRELRDRNDRRISYPQIAAWFGRDHTTVITGIRAHVRRAGIAE
jgi:hypothetical protein